ncbi:MAG TPA: excinuclease ABC subunit UvrC [Candidatus Bathyarchaeia archaeon]|nr:excinuclease ABC subunit UvrC [Candidatus Bathyarchaeia archaeon]
MSSAQARRLKEKASRFPASPGVYLMKNRSGRVLYVGKAKDLSARIRSYLQKPDALDVKTLALVRAADSIDYIATDTEVEALVLECTLIKEHRPRYNIRLKDDKRYPYLKLTTHERFARLALVRRVEQDGAEYFGPFTDATALRRTLRTVSTIFPLRDCRGERPGRVGGRECLNFHIGRCKAPCTGRITEDDYREIVDQVRLFLRGRGGQLSESMRERMWRLAREKRYEEAATARDQMEAFERFSERQRAVTPGGEDEDFVALAREGNLSCGVVMKIREGTILGKESFIIPAAVSERTADIFEAFFELYYHSATDIPPRIYVPSALADGPLAATWLSERSGRRVRIAVPRRGDKRSLLELAVRNASLQLATETLSTRASTPVLRELKDAIGLPATPVRIEAYDISNMQGSEAVGSMITFVNGTPLKSAYRRFRIREVRGSDDYAMIREVLSRRLARVKQGTDPSPDLVVVDGGKGQVTAVRQAMEGAEVAGIPIIGLAKKNEEIHVEGSAEPLRLPRRSPALRLLQRMRNEAHRFAVAYHRKLRSRRVQRSGLEDIRGIGAARRTSLLVEFGSLEALARASESDIAQVPGIGKGIARRIYEFLHGA